MTFLESISISFKKSAGGATLTFEAGREYLIANAQLEKIMTDENVRKRVYKISRADMRVPNFNVNTRKSDHRERILIYNGSGGYGDQIMTWPVARILSAMGYEVHVLTDPGNNVCWWNFPWIKSVNICPIVWEQVKLYDHFIVYETVVNMDEHQDQEHPIDVMLRKIGIDPRSVEPGLKNVRPNFTHLEMLSTSKFDGKEIAMYQLSATGPVRTYPPADSVFILLKLAEAFPEKHWLALYDEFVNPQYKSLLEEKIKALEIKNIQPYCAPNLRELWALTTRAKVVVSPDSMMVHVAGSLSVPCVGLWGPMAPANRAAYYPNHVPIFHREVCPHAPCFVCVSTFPKFCPPRQNRQVCEVLAAISPAEVIDRIKSITAPKV